MRPRVHIEKRSPAADIIADGAQGIIDRTVTDVILATSSGWHKPDDAPSSSGWIWLSDAAAQMLRNGRASS
jgi:hypothetical protein